jgi:ADP-heptose:LPS heptosyltransferase
MQQGPILVIKHGALGDIVQAFDAFAAVRRFHRDAEIVLMTAPAFAPLLGAAPWFDRLWLDPRPSPLNLRAWLAIRQRFLAERFTLVYDLQGTARTARYLRLIPRARRPEWAGDAPLASHRHTYTPGSGIAGRELAARRVQAGGVPPFPPGSAGLGWLDADVAGFALPGRFALLIPGCSPHLPHKRWPAASYGALANALASDGIESVIAGTAADRDAIAGVREAAPAARDLGGRTSLLQLGAIARRAAIAIGNDTGATFLAAALGTPTLMLMSRHTDPAFSAPSGNRSAWLKRDDLAGLSVAEVAGKVGDLLDDRGPYIARD